MDFSTHVRHQAQTGSLQTCRSFEEGLQAAHCSLVVRHIAAAAAVAVEAAADIADVADVGRAAKLDLPMGSNSARLGSDALASLVVGNSLSST